MSIRFGIITVSDRAASGERADASGPALAEAVEAQGWQVMQRDIMQDDLLSLRDRLADWADRRELDVILTTGGTGFSPRDVTPEASQAVYERSAPGIAEAMRNASLTITPHAMLSRATAGIRKRTLIINLPGSPKGALENFQVIVPVLPHAVQLLMGDPNAEAGHRLK
jgi:molybdopterin adenylyltransferase